MATRPDRLRAVALPRFAAPTTTIPTVRQPDGAVGGGTPIAPAAVDPRGLVPINRTQPVATDNMEAQRLMERRLGTMPPTSFSGAGAAFVPADRPVTALNRFGNSLSDFATMENRNAVVQSAAPLSAEAAADIARTQVYERGPINNEIRTTAAVEATGRRTPAMEELRERLEQRRLPPTQRAAQARLAALDRRLELNPDHRRAQSMTSYADQLRAALADPEHEWFARRGVRGGLLGQG